MLRRRTWRLIHTLQPILKWWQVENKFPVWEYGSLLSAVLPSSNIRVGVLVFPFLATFNKITEEKEGERGMRVKETGEDVIQVVVQAAVLKHLLSA